MLNLSSRRYAMLFSPMSEFRTKGLFGSRGNMYEKTQMFEDVLNSQCKTPAAVRRIVLGKPQKTRLSATHFQYIREEYDWVRNLLTNVSAKKQRGVNILIYGKPGTGKTELAKTLCKEIGASLFAVSDNRSERSGGERRSDLSAALGILQSEQNSVLLMDEAEDVFGASNRSFGFGGFGVSESGKGSKSKLFFNKLLESNEVPVIWICNSIDGVDPAHIRCHLFARRI